MSVVLPLRRSRAAKSQRARRIVAGNTVDLKALERRYLTAERLGFALDGLIDDLVAEVRGETRRGWPTRLKPGSTAVDSALILIDHQVGTMRGIRNIMPEVVARQTLALARAANTLHMPVVLTSSQEEDPSQGPLMPELKEILPGAFAARVKRAKAVDVWADRNFRKAVGSTGRRNLIIAAVTTHLCVVSPAISARSEGYTVHAVMDASGSHFEIAEAMIRRRMDDAGVVLTVTHMLLAQLDSGRWQREGDCRSQIMTQSLLRTVTPKVA